MKQCTIRTTNVRNTALLGSLVLSIGLFGSAYAEEVKVNVPFDEWNSETSMFSGTVLPNGTVIYIFEYRWMGSLDQIMREWIDKLPQTPRELAELTIPDRNVVIIPEVEEPTTPRTETLEERNLRLKEAAEEVRAEFDAETEALIGKLAECRTGLGAWAAYQEQEAIEGYTDQSRWQFAIRDNLSNDPQIGIILKAIEECRIMKTYADMNLIGAYELNKILADLAGLDYLGRAAEHPLAQKVTDQSDAMVETDPVTDKDIADEVTEMEELRDRLIAERVFEDPDADCIATADDPDKCTNRGFQPAGLRCSVFGQPAAIGVWAEEKCPLSLYEAHILKNWDDITYSDILTLQCDNFLYIYQHKLGTDDFPAWLNHCVPKVVRNN